MDLATLAPESVVNPAADQSSLPDRSADQQRLVTALASARLTLLDVNRRYDKRSAAERVAAQLAPYWDAERRRAAVIQDFARGLSAEIRAFDSTRLELLERVVLLIPRSEEAIGALATAMLASAGDAARRDPGPRGSEASGHLDDAKRELEDLDELGRVIGWELERSLRIAASLIAMREAELAQYLETVPELDLASLWSILSAAVAEEGAAKVAEEILVRGVGLAVPVASVAIGIVQAGRSLREKVEEMEAHYERGPLDRMFELAQQVTDDRELIALVVALLEAVDQSFAKLIDAVSG